MGERHWVNVDAGPIQLKRVRSAINALVHEGQTVVRLAGVRGEDESRVVIGVVGGEIRQDVVEAYEALGERFGWQITSQNQAEIVRVATAEAASARGRRPEVDERTTRRPAADSSRRFAELRALLAEAS